MKTCPICGTDLPRDAGECSNCGHFFLIPPKPESRTAPILYSLLGLVAIAGIIFAGVKISGAMNAGREQTDELIAKLEKQHPDRRFAAVSGLPAKVRVRKPLLGVKINEAGLDTSGEWCSVFLDYDLKKGHAATVYLTAYDAKGREITRQPLVDEAEPPKEGPFQGRRAEHRFKLSDPKKVMVVSFDDNGKTRAAMGGNEPQKRDDLAAKLEENPELDEGLRKLWRQMFDEEPPDFYHEFPQPGDPLVAGFVPLRDAAKEGVQVYIQGTIADDRDPPEFAFTLVSVDRDSMYLRSAKGEGVSIDSDLMILLPNFWVRKGDLGNR